MFYVYSIFNHINGKIYIGKTNNYYTRWQHHKRVSKGGKIKYPRAYYTIHAAIAKYGDNNFEFTVLQSFEKEDMAYLAEKYWIEFFKSLKTEYGYNKSSGGVGSGSGINSPNYGLKRTDDVKRKLRESHLGDKNHNFGKKFSDEVILNMSLAQRGKITGEDASQAKLTWEKVTEIRNLYKSGISVLELSKMFNCHKQNIYSIVKNKTWTIK